jgi:hypothetical protein
MQQDRPKTISVAMDAGEGLTFHALRLANLARLPRFKNRRGQPAHSEPDGSDWTTAEWGNATAGELGEVLVEFGKLLQICDTLKKLERGDLGELEDARQRLAHELADAVTYIDLTAYRCGVDLGAAIVEKFNEVSGRVGAEVYLE